MTLLFICRTWQWIFLPVFILCSMSGSCVQRNLGSAVLCVIFMCFCTHHMCYAICDGDDVWRGWCVTGIDRDVCWNIKQRLPYIVCLQRKTKFGFQQTKEICRFRFSFLANKRKYPFSVSSVFRLWNPGDMEIMTWRIEAWRHGDMGTWRHRKTENERLGFL